MRIMTSNIWGDFFNNPPKGRDAQLYSIYKKYNPDVLGFQEVTKAWYESSLFESLKSDYYFVGTECFNSDNCTPLAVKKEYSLIAKGFERLEDTPDASKTITWAVLERNGIRFAVCNTHFWWMRGLEPLAAKQCHGVVDFTPQDHENLRLKNAAQLVDLTKLLQSKFSCPVFAFGDMNAMLDEEIFNIYTQNGLFILINIAQEKDCTCSHHGNPVRNEKGEFFGVRATKDYVALFRKNLLRPKSAELPEYYSSIDHIIGAGNSFMVKQYRVIEEQDALNATDHSPVFADIEFI